MPPPPDVSAGSWREAELAAGEVLRRIQPTPASEATRSAIIAYLQALFRDNLGIEVFSLGSVPLKTYLPNGDIDLTAVGRRDSDFDIATDICYILKMENKKKDAMFEVKDVQYIQAELKLVKCLVQNIVVDISFNQIGGVCTLCFLEQIAHYLGKDNLFKQSIILIKGWCYYESRILGARHALFSTYALQTLVLYIILHFHSSLDGPFAVMYKFLDYFSKFDWEKYCVSVCGPVSLCNLPKLVVEPLDNDGGDIMFTMEFVESCLDMFPVSMRTSGNCPQVFLEKHLNIVDPLRESNNLGRSVSKSSYYRICSALAYGASKLGEILSLPEEVVADEMYSYFMDTLGKHRSRKRPDVVGDLYGSTFVVPLEHNSLGSNSSDLEAQKGKRNYSTLKLPAADTHKAVCEGTSCINLGKAHGTRGELGNPPLNHHQTTNCSQLCHLTYCSMARNKDDDTSIRPVPFNLIDFTGNFELHFRNLIYAYQLLYGELIAPDYHLLRDMHAWHNTKPNTNQTGLPPGLSFPLSYCRMNSPSMSGPCNMVEDAQKHQGIGTYVPQKGYDCHQDRQSVKITTNMPSPSEPPAVFVNDRALKILDTNLLGKNTHNPISKDHYNKRKNSDKRARSAESCSQLPRASRSHFAAGLVAIPGTKLDTSHESSWQSIPMVTENSHNKPVLMRSYTDGVVLGPASNAQFGSLGFVPMVTAPPYTRVQFGSLGFTPMLTAPQAFCTRSQLINPQHQGFWQVSTSTMQVGGNSYCGRPIQHSYQPKD